MMSFGLETEWLMCKPISVEIELYYWRSLASGHYYCFNDDDMSTFLIVNIFIIFFFCLAVSLVKQETKPSPGLLTILPHNKA